MKTIGKILTILCATALFNVCVSYKDFPAKRSIDQSIDYSDPNLKLNFNWTKTYRIWVDDGRMFEMTMIDESPEKIIGVLKKNAKKPDISGIDKFEIPRNRIKEIKESKPNPVATGLLVGTSVILLIYGISAIVWTSTWNSLVN